MAGLVIAAIATASGCAGVNTFSSSARAGDTVALSLGWNQPITRDNLRVDITSGSASYTYAPNDPNVRMVANFYPDPASRLIVGRETNQSLGVNASAQAQNLETTVTGNDKDYAQTMLLVDLPATLPTGTATIKAMSATTLAPIGPDIAVTIIDGGGSPATLAGTGGPATPEMLGALERSAFKTVSFSGSVISYALQLDLTYTPASGTPWVVNPRGDLKNVSWTVDGTGGRLKIILLPANQVNPTQWSVFKLLVAGDMSGLAIDQGSVKAFDASGNPVTGITAQLN